MSTRLHSYRNLAAALGGNAMEFYDFIIYALSASYLAILFFPSSNSILSSLWVFAGFACGYVMRPIGALFFGYIGDTCGRKKALIYAISCMTLSTVAIGLLPDANTAGAWAPCLLVTCRLVQGFSVSGEEVGAAIYLFETHPENQRGWLGSLIFTSAYWGVLLGSIACLITTLCFSEMQILHYAWRIPFILSLLIGLSSLWLRLSLNESMDYQSYQDTQNVDKNPIRQIIKNYRKSMLSLVMLIAPFAIATYFMMIVMPNYLKLIHHFSSQHTLIITCLSLLFASIAMPFFGILSDKIGHQRQFALGCIMMLALGYPIVMALNQASYVSLIVAFFCIDVLIFLIASPLFAIIIDAFPVAVRYTGTALVFNLSLALFGSTTPLLAFYLLNTTLDQSLLGLQLIVAAILGVAGLIGQQRHSNSSSFFQN